MDFEQARFNMIEQQIRTWDVLDQRVLDTLGEFRGIATCAMTIVRWPIATRAFP